MRSDGAASAAVAPFRPANVSCKVAVSAMEPDEQQQRSSESLMHSRSDAAVDLNLSTVGCFTNAEANEVLSATVASWAGGAKSQERRSKPAV